jgi:hypothetical protein
LFQSFSYSFPGFWEEGGMFKGMHFDRSVILLLVCPCEVILPEGVVTLTGTS